MTLAEMVQELIDHHGMTEARIAKVIGIQQPTVHRIKRGIGGDPRYSTGKAIEQLYYTMITKA